jgi:GTP-binding protein YchF
VDALVHVVRAFESDTVPHPDGSVGPLRDASVLELEFILADLGTVDRRLERLEANIKKANKAEDVAERVLFRRLKEALEAERPIREMDLSDDEVLRLRGYALLSGKPLLLVANLGEKDLKSAPAVLERSGLAGFARKPQVALCAVSAPIEAELGDLSPEDAEAFRQDLGLAEPGLERVIRSTYDLLGLISFLTAGEDECRAWTIRRGTRAVAAAGAIHSDIERGFIRAQVVAFDDLVAAGGVVACRERGTLRLEGKDYEVKDGDVIEFRHAT